MTIDDQAWLAERFEANRAQLRRVAFRMLGSLTEADDAVQEAWIRLRRTETSKVDNLQAWLTTVVGRVCPTSGPPLPGVSASSSSRTPSPWSFTAAGSPNRASRGWWR